MILGAFGTNKDHRAINLRDLELRILLDTDSGKNIIVPQGVAKEGTFYFTTPVSNYAALKSEEENCLLSFCEISVNPRSKVAPLQHTVRLAEIPNNLLSKLRNILPGVQEEMERRQATRKGKKAHRAGDKTASAPKAGPSEQRIVKHRDAVADGADPEEETGDESAMNRGFREDGEIDENPLAHRLGPEVSGGQSLMMHELMSTGSHAKLAQARLAIMTQWGEVQDSLRKLERTAFEEKANLHINFMRAQSLGISYMHEIERRLRNLTVRYANEGASMSVLYFRGKADLMAGSAEVTAYVQVLLKMQEELGRVQEKLRELMDVHGAQDVKLRKLVSGPMGVVFSEEARWVLDRSEPRGQLFSSDWVVPSVDPSSYCIPWERREWHKLSRDSSRPGTSHPRFLQDMKDLEFASRGIFPRGLTFAAGAAALAASPRFDHTGAMGGGQSSVTDEAEGVNLHAVPDEELNPHQIGELHDVLSTDPKGADPMDRSSYATGHQFRFPSEKSEDTTRGSAQAAQTSLLSTSKESGPSIPAAAQHTPRRPRSATTVRAASDNADSDCLVVDDTPKAGAEEEFEDEPQLDQEGYLQVTNKPSVDNTRGRSRIKKSPSSSRESSAESGTSSIMSITDVVDTPSMRRVTGRVVSSQSQRLDDPAEKARRKEIDSAVVGMNEHDLPGVSSRRHSKRSGSSTSQEGLAAKRQKTKKPTPTKSVDSKGTSENNDTDDESYVENKRNYVASLPERLRNGDIDIGDSEYGSYRLEELQHLLKQTSRSLIEYLELDDVDGKNFRLRSTLATWFSLRKLNPQHLRDHQRASLDHFKRPSGSSKFEYYGDVVIKPGIEGERRYIFPLGDSAEEFRANFPQLNEFVFTVVEGLFSSDCNLVVKSILLVALQAESGSKGAPFVRSGIYGLLFGAHAVRRKTMIHPPTDQEKSVELIRLSGESSEVAEGTLGYNKVYQRKELVACPLCPYMRLGDFGMCEHLFSAHLGILPICGGCQEFVFMPPTTRKTKSAQTGKYIASAPVIPGVPLKRYCLMRDWVSHYGKCEGAAKIRQEGTDVGFGMARGAERKGPSKVAERDDSGRRTPE